MWTAWARTWLIDQPSRTGVVGIYQTFLCWCHRPSYARIQSYELPWLDHSTWRSGSWTCSELESIRTVTKNYAGNEATYQVFWFLLFWFNVLRYSFLKTCHYWIVLRRWLGKKVVMFKFFYMYNSVIKWRCWRFYVINAPVVLACTLRWWHVHLGEKVLETRCLHLNWSRVAKYIRKHMGFFLIVYI